MVNVNVSMLTGQPRMGRLTEREIRRALIADLKSKHLSDPDTRIIQELGVCKGKSRIDIALINGSMNGFEIKSPDDTLERLQSQAQRYDSVFDTVTIVYSGRSDETIRDSVPIWWGLCRAERDDDGCVLIEVRGAMPNPSQESVKVAQLLWRDEVLSILVERGLADGYRSKTREILWKHLAEHVSLLELKDIVRSALKTRVGWRDSGR